MIRLGTPDDAEGVARVHVQTWQAAYAHALPHEQLQALSMQEAVERSRRWPPTFVAEREGEILGFVSVGSSRDPGTDGELFAIYVHPHLGDRRRTRADPVRRRRAPQAGTPRCGSLGAG